MRCRSPGSSALSGRLVPVRCPVAWFQSLSGRLVPVRCRSTGSSRCRPTRSGAVVDRVLSARCSVESLQLGGQSNLSGLVIGSVSSAAVHRVVPVRWFDAACVMEIGAVRERAYGLETTLQTLGYSPTPPAQIVQSSACPGLFHDGSSPSGRGTDEVRSAVDTLIHARVGEQSHFRLDTWTRAAHVSNDALRVRQTSESATCVQLSRARSARAGRSTITT
jgi:hypothetical protein